MAGNSLSLRQVFPLDYMFCIFIPVRSAQRCASLILFLGVRCYCFHVCASVADYSLLPLGIVSYFF